MSWEILPFVALFVLLVMSLIVRLVLDLLAYRKRRSMRGYTMRYGACEYMGTARPNFRREERL